MIKARWFVYLLSAVCCSLACGAVAAQSSLPSAKEIVQRYDEALGGRGAIMRHTSSTTRGTMEAHDGATVFKLPSFTLRVRPSSAWRKFPRQTAPATS